MDTQLKNHLKNKTLIEHNLAFSVDLLDVLLDLMDAQRDRCDIAAARKLLEEFSVSIRQFEKQFKEADGQWVKEIGKEIDSRKPAYIRALAALAPDMAERQIAILQVGGDGYAVSQTTSPGRIRWNARLTTLEASTLHRIFSTQSKLLQDIVLQGVLEPLEARQRDAPSSDDILATLAE